MAVNTFGFPTPQAFSGGADFSPLANLGNVYRQGQQNRLADLAFSQMTGNPQQDAMLLIKSGHPNLVPLGVRMLNEQQTRAEQVREFGITSGLQERRTKLEEAKQEQDTEEYRTAQQKRMIDEGTLPPESMKDPAWSAWRATGQNIPSSAIVQPQTSADRNAIRQADDEAEAARTAISSVDRMGALNEKAFHGIGSGAVGYAASFLPEGYGGEAGVATESMRNEALRQMMANVKGAFGARPSDKEDQWMLEAQGGIGKSYAEQKDILKRGRELLEQKLRYNADKANEMRPEGKGYYSKEHHVAGEAPPRPEFFADKSEKAAPSTPTGQGTALATPSLGEFMKAARAHNPGVSDSELANYWKKKYGGGPETDVATAPAPPISR